ncbi:MAG: hypothetical protein M5U18_05490 [Dehalococcoidia bacterium]|nr:hypothetical protein [Dehalococcoidia bacterium]
MSALFPGEFTYRVVEAASIGSADLAIVQALFAENYREANLAYLEKSLGKLRYLALATHVSGAPAGFALGESRMLDLPRLPQTTVRLAGLCCVGMAFRRQGLFVRLEGMVLSEGRVVHGDRWLATGRMAHPGSFRSMSKNGSVVPAGEYVPPHGSRPSEPRSPPPTAPPSTPRPSSARAAASPSATRSSNSTARPRSGSSSPRSIAPRATPSSASAGAPMPPPRWDDPEVTP